jgi:hypothetical protein
MIKFYDLFTYVTPAKEELSPEDVRQILEERFRQEGRSNRAVGAIRSHGEEFLRADTVSPEGDIVKTLEVNKFTGAWSV